MPTRIKPKLIRAYDITLKNKNKNKKIKKKLLNLMAGRILICILGTTTTKQL